jgi:hypothetical protein
VRKRPNVTLTLAPHELEALDWLATRAGMSRSRYVAWLATQEHYAMQKYVTDAQAEH